MKKKKLLSITLAAAMGVSLLAGCSNSKENASGQDGKATVKIATWDDDYQMTVNLVEEFKKTNSNIDVQVDKFPSAEYQQKLMVQLAGGSEYDLFATKNNADYSDIATKNQALALDSYIEKDKMDVSGYGPMLNGVKLDGKTYGLPYRKTAWVLFYNKNLFDEAKLSYPKADMTWEEFRELSKKLTKGEGNGKVYGAYLHTWPISWFQYGVQTGASIVDKDLTPFKAALENRLNLEKDGSIMKYTDAVATNAHYKTVFEKGNAAMVIIGDWMIAQLRADEKNFSFDWDIAPVPHPQGVSANTSTGMPTMLSISAKSKNKDAAWSFLKYFAGPEGAKEFAKAGILPGYSNDEINKLYVGEGNQKPKNMGIILNQKIYVEYPAVPGINNVVNDIYNNEAKLTFSGERSVDDTISKISERIKNEIK